MSPSSMALTNREVILSSAATFSSVSPYGYASHEAGLQSLPASKQFPSLPCCVPFGNRMQKGIVIGGSQPQPLAKLFAVFTEALLELRFAQNPFDLRRGFLQRLPVSGFHREKLQLSFQPVIHFKQSGDISRLELRKAVLPCRIKAVPIHDATSPPS